MMYSEGTVWHTHSSVQGLTDLSASDKVAFYLAQV